MNAGDLDWPNWHTQRHDLKVIDAGTFHLGVDPSLTKTGVAGIHASRLDTFLLIPPNGLRGPARLIWYRDAFSGFLNAQRRRLHLSSVTIEGYAYSQVNAAHKLGELGGILRALFWEMDVPLYEAYPQTLKKFVTGKGSAGKGGMPLGLYRRWDLFVDQEDQADATAAALIGANMTCRQSDLTIPMKEALEKVNVVRAPPPRIRTRNN